MREANSSMGMIMYPDEIVFAFNPILIRVETSNNVTFTVGDYTDVREPMNGVVEIDISKYVQTMVSKDVRRKTIYASVSDGDETFSFSTVAIWGGINIGERFNGDYRLRWWRGLPFTMEMYIPEDAVAVRGRYDGNGYVDLGLIGWTSVYPEVIFPDTTEKAVLRVDTADKASVWEYTFDGTFTGVDAGNVRLYRLDVNERNECGVYLRWVDRHGWLRYWLFDRGQETVEAKNKEELRSVWSKFRVRRYAKKDVVKTVKLCAPSVNDEELTMLEQLGTSVVVDMWTGDEWCPVTIDDVSVTRGGKDWRPLNDYECVMRLPDVATQNL